MRPLVLVPALNEARTISKVLEHIHVTDPGLPVLVVDDGSSDDTSDVARRSGAHVVRLPFNLGVGTALQTGYKYALRHGYDCVVQLDADGQHEPADIPRLLAPLAAGSADMVIGSRFLAATSYRPAVARRAGMRLFGLLALLLTGVRFTDVTSGFRALARPVLAFCTEERYPADYPDADFLVMLTRAGFRITEVPARMYPREGGTSQHAGLRPLYYVFKMLLSLFLTRLRREPRGLPGG